MYVTFIDPTGEWPDERVLCDHIPRKDDVIQFSDGRAARVWYVTWNLGGGITPVTITLQRFI